MSLASSFMARNLMGLASLGVCTMLSWSASAGPTAAEAYPSQKGPTAVLGGLNISQISYDEEREHIGMSMAVPYLPRVSYHREVFTTKNRYQNWRNGGLRETLRWNLPYGLVFAAGRVEQYGGGPMRQNRQDNFLGLTFSSSQYQRSKNRRLNEYLGVDRGAPMPDHLSKGNNLRLFKTTFTLALVALMANGDGGGGSAAANPSDPLAEDGWNLTWSDEFSGSTLDTSKWSTTDSYGRDQCFGGGNNEQQCYTSSGQNISVEDGKLVLTARPTTGLSQGRTYSSGRVQSNGKGDFTYGRFEARIKLPTGQGSWPAFWMLPSDRTYGQWPRSGEIDVIESVNLGVNNERTVHGTIHYGEPHNYTGGETELSDINAFHTYAVEWYSDEMRWFVDGVQYSRKTSNQWFSSGAPNDANAPFDQDFHLILNLAIGGNWPGNTDGQGFPRQMEIDYVRVFECGGADPDACK